MTMVRAWFARGIAILVVVGAGAALGQTRVIEWGTALEPAAQVAAAKALAKSIVQPGSAAWQAKGDQKRSYRFPDANATIPYRVCVPSAWDGKSSLALVMFLHGAGNTESSYLDANNKQMVKLADQHGVVLVSAMGHQSAYGTFIRLPAVFGKPEEVAPMLAKKTPESEKANELSERDVLNVLELVRAEYPIDSTAMFLTGHSMGSGGTWYLGGKYPGYWRGLAPMSGPFVTETGYPWDRMLKMPVFVTEGTGSATTQSSRELRDWLLKKGAPVRFKEVNADHAGMVPLVLPDVFNYFDSLRRNPTRVTRRMDGPMTAARTLVVKPRAGRVWSLPCPIVHQGRAFLSLSDASGAIRLRREVPIVGGRALLLADALPTGVYRADFSTAPIPPAR
jgi:pimeloyl-ACP methyl ester carboxylesterase